MTPHPTAGAPQSAAGGPVYQLASWGSRVGAAAIDFLVRLAIIAAPAALGATLFVVGTGAGVAGVIAGGISGVVLASFVYAPMMMTRTNGQTIGHRSMGTRIVMADGSRMTGGRAFVREVLVKNLLMEGVGGLTLYILTIVNYLFPLWSAERQALHDMICKTRVVVA